MLKGVAGGGGAGGSVAWGGKVLKYMTNKIEKKGEEKLKKIDGCEQERGIKDSKETRGEVSRWRKGR